MTQLLPASILTTLLFAKFVPGLGAFGPTMAGWTRLPLLRVVAVDHAGVWLLALVLLLLAAWLSWKLYQRRRFIRGLRVARIQPEELMELILSSEPPAIVDLRHAIEVEADPARIPGAVRIDFERFDEQASRIPTGCEIILYCS